MTKNIQLMASIVVWLGSVTFATMHNPIKFGEMVHSLESGYGTAALPVDVIEMKALAERYELASFRLSDVYSDALIFQRAVEYLYPVTFDVGSRIVFAPLGAIAPGCREIGKTSRVMAYACN